MPELFLVDSSLTLRKSGVIKGRQAPTMPTAGSIMDQIPGATELSEYVIVSRWRVSFRSRN
jgi:hypothetical protein